MMWQWDEIVWHRTADFILTLEQPGLVFFRSDAQLIAERFALFYFYPDAPFHFYELYAAQAPHTFDGWYCNINLSPQRTRDGFSFIDIDLDLWVYPDLTYDLLDEEEYREHAATYQYPDEIRETAGRTVDVLRGRIAREMFPFRRHVKTLGEEIAALAGHYHIPPLSFSPQSTTVKP